MHGSMRLTLGQGLALVLALGLGACQSREARDEPAADQAVPETGTTAESAEPAAANETLDQPASEPTAPATTPAKETKAAGGAPGRSSPLPEASPRPTVSPAPGAPPEPTRPVEPPPPPEPRIIEVTIPEGTVLELELLTALDTSVNQVGDEIQARTLSPVYAKGEPVLAQGTYVEGRVTEVQASGRVKGRAQLGFTFDRLSTRSGIKTIRSSYVEKEAASGKKKDATIIGGGAGIGALVGGIIGGKKGAAVGAAVGGAGGTGVVLATKGEEIRLPVGTEVNVRLDAPVVIQMN